MKELAERVLNAAQLSGAIYADVRLIQEHRQFFSVKNGLVEAPHDEEKQGFGVRVLLDGAWGFASSSNLELKTAEQVTGLALRIARASAGVKNRDVSLGQPEVHTARYETPLEVDPFSVSEQEKISFLLSADTEMQRVKGIRSTRSTMEFIQEDKLFASSEGSWIEQRIIESGAGIEATAVGNNDAQSRSFPNNLERQQGTGGYELISRLELSANAGRIAEEAVALLSAASCPRKTTTIILDATILSLQLHESCGHATELDRVLGDEASYAGTSFLTLEKMGVYRYGSPLVNIYLDSTMPGALGTFGFDDEGVPAQRSPLILEGIHVGYHTSRETAAILEQRSNGCMRADGWNRTPIIRMTNIILQPGTWELDNLIADTDDGIYMLVNKSWSIDNQRLNFQFGAQVGYEITGGKLGRLIKNPTYTGVTPQFWGACDAICNENHFRIYGLPFCGKGEPWQGAPIGHGAAPARFRNVQVGAGGA